MGESYSLGRPLILLLSLPCLQKICSKCSLHRRKMSTEYVPPWVPERKQHRLKETSHFSEIITIAKSILGIQRRTNRSAVVVLSFANLSLLLPCRSCLTYHSPFTAMFFFFSLLPQSSFFCVLLLYTPTTSCYPYYFPIQ